MKLFNRSTKAGFTLVELIVVIAILGILAGVAIPVYSGYIKRANEAADQQLLGAVNTAYSAAALENNKDPRSVNASATVSSSGVSVSPFNDEFQKYFAGNGTFKVFKSLVYIKADGVFVGSKVAVTSNGNGTYTVTLANGQEVTYTVSDEAKAAVMASTYGTNLGMGTVLDDVGSMVDSLATALGGGAFIANLIGSDNLAAWGIEPDENGKYNTDDLANAAVLYAARLVPEGSAAGITSMMSDATTLNGVIGAMQSGKLETIGNNIKDITAFYAMATAFAGSDDAAGWSITVGEGDAAQTYNAIQYYDLVNQQIAAAAADTSMNQTQKAGEIMTAMSQLSNMMMTNGSFNSQYTDYVSNQLSADASGFEEAMQAIAANSDALVASGAIQSGYNTGDINAILNGIFGGN